MGSDSWHCSEGGERPLANPAEDWHAPDNSFTATNCRMKHDEYFVNFVFSCGPKDGLVFITMTKAQFIKDFIEPLQRRLEA